MCDRLCQVLDCRGRYGLGGVFFFSFWDPSALWAEEDRGFKKDYERNLQNVKFFKKVNKQVKTGLMTMSREGLRVGRRSRVHLCAMVLPSLLLDYRSSSWVPGAGRDGGQNHGRLRNPDNATRTTQTTSSRALKRSQIAFLKKKLSKTQRPRLYVQEPWRRAHSRLACAGEEGW